MNKSNNFNASGEERRVQLDRLVFFPPFLLLVALLILSAFYGEYLAKVFTDVFYWCTYHFSWLEAITVFGIVLGVASCLFTPIGNVRFGGPNAKPQMKTWNWFAISLCAGIGISIVFWGFAEPLNHLANLPPSIGKPFSAEAAQFSMTTLFMHWSFSPYCLYVISGIPIALAYYNYKKPFRPSSGLYFIMGDKCNDGIGTAVDILCLFALAGNVAQSLGLGIMQVSSGITYILQIAPSVALLVTVGVSVTAMFTVSSYSGIQRGVKFLSSQNTKIYIFMLAFVFILGPTTSILDTFVQTTGNYLNNFVERSLWVGAFDTVSKTWNQDWTAFYWASWIGYAPLIGMFLGRIVYGRTVREFILINVCAPSLFALAWFSTMSGTAIQLQMSGKADLWSTISASGLESSIFAFFNAFPFAQVMIPIAVIAVVISFVTLADGMTTCCANMSTKNYGYSPDSIDALEPPKRYKILWGIIIGALAIMFCIMGQVNAVKMLATLTGFPIIIILIAFLWAVFKLAYMPQAKYCDQSLYYKEIFTRKESIDEVCDEEPSLGGNPNNE